MGTNASVFAQKEKVQPTSIFQMIVWFLLTSYVKFERIRGFLLWTPFALEIMVRAVMSLYRGAKTRVRVGSAYSEEFKVKVGVHQRSVLSPLLFATVVDVIAEKVIRGVVNELLYADDLFLMSENMKDLKEKFLNWKNALESKV